jgi:hypothetical protein
MIEWVMLSLWDCSEIVGKCQQQACRRLAFGYLLLAVGFSAIDFWAKGFLVMILDNRYVGGGIFSDGSWAIVS